MVELIRFTVRRKTSFASAAYATANLSVRLSATVRYCVKTRERRGMQSSPPGSPVSLVFWCQEWLMGTTKTLKICYKVSLSKNFQRQSYSAINYLSNGISILAGDDSVPRKFRPIKAPPQCEGCAFHVSHAARCAVSDSRPSCVIFACRILPKNSYDLWIIRSPITNVAFVRSTSERQIRRYNNYTHSVALRSQMINAWNGNSAENRWVTDHTGREHGWITYGSWESVRCAKSFINFQSTNWLTDKSLSVIHHAAYVSADKYRSNRPVAYGLRDGLYIIDGLCHRLVHVHVYQTPRRVFSQINPLNYWPWRILWDLQQYAITWCHLASTIACRGYM